MGNDPTAGKTAEQLIMETAPKVVAQILIVASTDGKVHIKGEPADAYRLERLIIAGLKVLWETTQTRPQVPRIIPP